MTRRSIALAFSLAAALAAPTALAQSTPPDLRSIPPAVMLLVDTSGSMERLPGCVCTTPGCNECLPACDPSGTSERNRWAMTLEALTGSWTTFVCESKDRRLPLFNGQYDDDYYLPYHDPALSGAQNSDGILDVYRTRAHFGLMTFDGAGTLVQGDPLVPAAVFSVDPFQTTQRGAQGMWSYGDNRPFSFPGCATTYMINNGARASGASEGGLVSVGLEDPSTDFDAINQLVQDRLVATRPFGGTPIAGMLDDARYYFENDPDATTDDPFQACRPRFTILVTDGYPDSDFRDARFNCEAAGYSCPYDRAEDIAGDLCRYDSATAQCTGRLDGVYVVGFDIADATAIAGLNDIANLGGTDAALFANDRASLISALSSVLDRAAADVTTRTAPSFAESRGSAYQAQYQFQSGFLAGNTLLSGVRVPWSGALERRRIECDGLTPVVRDITDADRFHVILNDRSLSAAPRDLRTVVTDPADLDDTIIGAAAGVALEPFSKANTAVDASVLNVVSSSRRDAIIDWVHGDVASTDPRSSLRLGDLYHSSPAVLGAPTDSLADETYNLYRERPEVANRPMMLYVGTNDGILHAFAAEDTNILAGPHTGDAITAGTELWGFVPPILLPKLDEAVSSHQFMVDATPIVREVYWDRPLGSAGSADIYHAVVIGGLRGGGSAFYALDVTDPLDPVFLWQFSGPDMGLTYGMPGVGHVTFEYDGLVQTRAVAVLPGGAGVIDTGAGATCVADPGSVPDVATERTTATRNNRRCWQNDGRSLFVVDVETGELLKSFDHVLISSPMSGGVSLYPGETGSVATRAYVTDADGVIWRLDLSSRTPDNWSLEPFHDIFWDDATGNLGQPAYEPPLVSTDPQGRVVVMVATGDIDRLEGTARNRVVSVRENTEFDTTGQIMGFTTYLNWQISLAAGEQVTGPLDLFDRKLYFGTFVSMTSPSDACQFGESYLWGVHYTQDDGATLPGPTAALEWPAGSGTLEIKSTAFENTIIMGAAVTQRPRCFSGVTETDPYFGGTRYRVTGSGGGEFTLVAQMSGMGGTAAGGAAVSTYTQVLPTPNVAARIAAYGGQVE